MTSIKPSEPGPDIIPDILCDAAGKKRYQRGRFLGKGGFAKCYELTDLDNGQVFAGKIVSKQLLVKPHQKDKMAQEISIHRSLKHDHVVGFHSFFEDNNFVYIVLELCKRRSLMELHKRRKAVTEPEARYFMHQLLLGVKYLHENKMIHRDLKLGNLFLNDNMELKIGDFGLATKLDFSGERKKTLCGTPNYIAPEVLNKKGHSFEVDIWSMGCILYTLLVGRPPFETQSLKDTYSKIKRNEYHIPSRIGPLARALISRMLQGDPACRPAVDIVLNDEFMTCGYMPTRLPLSCLTMAPRFDAKLNSSIIAVRRPLGEVNRVHLPGTAEHPQGDGLAPSNEPNHAENAGALYTAGPSPEKLLRELQQQLTRLFSAKPAEKFPLMMDEAEDPGSVPMVWISKWVDYSDKYGFGYQLSDDTIGVIFNDLTKLLLLVDAKTIQYVERNGNELYYTMDQHPPTLGKKVKLLAYFRSYMQEHLIKTGASVVPRDGDEHLRLPFLRQWFRTSRAVVMHLTSGTLQINYFKDHVKLILCPLMGAVTVIDEKKNFRTFKFSLLAEHGCNPDLLYRLQYAHEKLPFLLSPLVDTQEK
ncbi:serine/threonine-protein kinase PLK1-like [Daphnia pulicaria]|uniref:serine/threonine-protein kinase PLK1-like n=1 Tax=Daphnia pulicaria TaxID=35523 RepID=UPI001EEC87C6|nr:serine/threonine-protein kinase PLK1-like [Daphnia pulicaria]